MKPENDKILNSYKSKSSSFSTIVTTIKASAILTSITVSDIDSVALGYGILVIIFIHCCVANCHCLR